MFFNELVFNKLDNGWLVRYSHVMRRPDAQADEAIGGMVAFGSLEQAIAWVGTNSSEHKRVAAPPEKKS